MTTNKLVDACPHCGDKYDQYGKELSAIKLEARIAPIPEEKCSDDTADAADMECEDYKTSAHPDKCIGNVTEPSNPTCSNTTHKHSYCDCKEPVSLDPAQKITHEGNVHAKDKQQDNEVARLRDIAEIAMQLAKTSLNVHKLSIPKVNHSCDHQNATIRFYETLNNLNKLVSSPEKNIQK